MSWIASGLIPVVRREEEAKVLLAKSEIAGALDRLMHHGNW
jgi:hypothetical protein